MTPGLALVLALALQAPAGVEPPALEVTTQARAVQPGEIVVVDVTASEAGTAVTIAALGQTVTAFADGPGDDHRSAHGPRWRAVLGIDLDLAPGSYPMFARAERPGGPLVVERRLTVEPKAFATRTLKVAPDFVNPPPSIQRRIERESKMLQAAFASGSRERLWGGPFVRPVPHASNSRFGTRSVFNGEARNPHTGADFLSPSGTPVKAPNAGRVIVAASLFFSGNTVIIDHGLGIFSQMAHLSRIDVREGEAVGTGQTVGLVGATGRVTGPHLHWGLRVGTARVDPISLLALLGGDGRAPR